MACFDSHGFIVIFFYIHYCINRLDKRYQIYLEVAVIDRCPDWYTPVRGDHQEVDTADVLCPHRLRVYQLSQTLEHVLCDVRNHRRLQNQQPLGVLHSKIKLLYMYHINRKDNENISMN